MPRKTRPGIITLYGSVACGAADATNLILGPDATASDALVTPYDNCTFLGCTIVQRAVGTGSGSFSVTIAYGATPTVISETSANTLVVAAAAVGTYHGYVEGYSLGIPIGQQLKLTTVKTGTVSGNATLAVTLMFMV